MESRQLSNWEILWTDKRTAGSFECYLPQVAHQLNVTYLSRGQTDDAC